MRDRSSSTRSMIVSSGDLPRMRATSASVLPVSGLSASDLNSTRRMRSADPAARYRVSQVSDGVRIALAIFARFDQPIPFAAHVGDVNTVVLRSDLRDLDQLVGRRVEAGRVNEG